MVTTRRAFVQVAVAVVVLAITGFGLGAWGNVWGAVQSAAGAVCLTFRAHAWECACAWLVVDSISVVDGAIAVIVLSVACFGSWLISLVALKLPIFAGIGTCFAHSVASGDIAGIADIGECPIIAVSVTIVVEAIADFWTGSDCLFALDGSASAFVNAVVANTQGTGGACIASIGWIVVDGTVAVIVEAVASFGFRGGILDALDLAILALGCTRSALAGLIGDVALLPAARIAVVDLSVAIVIESVAGFARIAAGSSCSCVASGRPA